MQTILWRETVLDRQRENYLYNLKKFCLLFVVLFFFLNLPMRLKNKNLLPHMAFRPILLAFTVIPPISNTRNVQSTLSSTNYFVTSIQKKKKQAVDDRAMGCPSGAAAPPFLPLLDKGSSRAPWLLSASHHPSLPLPCAQGKPSTTPCGLSHRSRLWRPWSSLQQANYPLLR
jgi:hypothetical protein